MTKPSIEERVMGNIAVIYAARKLMSVTALKFYALVFSGASLAAFVSLPSIAENFVKVAEGGVGNVALFVFSALLSTTLVVQLAVVLGAFAAISLVTPALRGGRAFA